MSLAGGPPNAIPQRPFVNKRGVHLASNYKNWIRKSTWQRRSQEALRKKRKVAGKIGSRLVICTTSGGGKGKGRRVGDWTKQTVRYGTIREQQSEGQTMNRTLPEDGRKP